MMSNDAQHYNCYYIFYKIYNYLSYTNHLHNQ